ncbi:MAG: Hsp20/alpha crystallin family protein [Clostridia bacterium]|nr:Hsp20/alpha crystallin family protein [Clostridia bacterium]
MLALTPFVRRGAVAPYDPFRELENLERRFFGREALPVFSVDICEETDRYVLEADLPGFLKEDIHLDIEGQYLTLRAERKMAKDGEGAEVKYLRSERFYGTFSRTFDLSGVDADALHATYENGVLRVLMPKKKAQSPEKRELTID